MRPGRRGRPGSGGHADECGLDLCIACLVFRQLQVHLGSEDCRGCLLSTSHAGHKSLPHDDPDAIQCMRAAFVLGYILLQTRCRVGQLGSGPQQSGADLACIV